MPDRLSAPAECYNGRDSEKEIMAFKLLVFLSCLVFAADSTGQTVRVTWDVNGDAILPVHLNTTLDNSSVTIIWTFHGNLVHTFTSGKTDQGTDYTDRTSLFEEEIPKGNVSLKLMKVTEKDAGQYTCTVYGGSIKNREFTVILDISIHVSATINGTIILPVHLRTEVDTDSTSIRWKFVDKDVLSYTNGKPYGNNEFKDRASFFEDKIPDGNISLKLRNIAENEIGIYTCEFKDNINKLKNKIIVFLSVTPENPTNPSDQGKSPHRGLIIGVGIGVAACLVTAFLIYKWCKDKRPTAAAATLACDAQHLRQIQPMLKV